MGNIILCYSLGELALPLFESLKFYECRRLASQSENASSRRYTIHSTEFKAMLLPRYFRPGSPGQEASR
jgi:hypothetical protein